MQRLAHRLAPGMADCHAHAGQRASRTEPALSTPAPSTGTHDARARDVGPALRNATEPSLQAQGVPARVIESALDVARAEVALLMVHVRAVAIQAVAALLVTILGAAFAQITIVLLVLAPLLSEYLSSTRLAFAIGLPGLLTLLCAWAARAAWRGIPGRTPTAPMVEESWSDARDPLTRSS